MICTVEDIRRIVAPIAEKYNIRSVYLFGSYARGTATEDSDIDLIIDTAGTAIKSLFALGAVYAELEAALGKSVDLLTLSSFTQEMQRQGEAAFRKNVSEERVLIYDVA